MQHSALLRTVEESTSPSLARFASDVRDGLTGSPKQLSAEYFYDQVGSALFEAITVLPEYGLSRADGRILWRHADDIVARAPSPVCVLELGSGSGSKTAHVLRSVSQRQGFANYYPIDVSRSALDQCARELSKSAHVHPIHDTFVDGVTTALSRIPKGDRVLLLFLGSTIGNFDHTAAYELLTQLQAILTEGDMMLIGADLVKPADQLIVAYDDPAGVTAAFNLNLLARINRELGADFDLRRFRHEARYNAVEKRIEMHLVSLNDQCVRIPHAHCTVRFVAGESIWTESSHKYEISDLEAMATRGGFRVRETWTDQEWPFAESLWEVSGP
jgi:L-histidine N-alpha-methyltransferase